MTSDPIASALRPQRILVVDDEPLVLQSIRMLLELDGHVVEAQGSANRALEKFGPSQFDLVITDYQMPDMVGTEFAREVRRRAPEQPIMMISAYSETITAGGKYPAGIDLILDKPFSLEMLRAALRRLLGGRKNDVR